MQSENFVESCTGSGAPPDPSGTEHQEPARGSHDSARTSLLTCDARTYQCSPADLAPLVQEALRDEGHIILEHFDAAYENEASLRAAFENLCARVGTPAPHVGDKIVWDIRMNASSDNLIKTYSEHNHDADLHTDSQYSARPEDSFALMTLRPAQCGGGASQLLHLHDILCKLRAQPDGARIEEILRTTDFPFVVPNVFNTNATQTHEFNHGPILTDAGIRFRVDTIAKAIASRPDFVTKEQVEAFESLKKIILECESTIQFHLKTGDLIFINNKTTLHGRSAFTDPNRHLLRIRLFDHPSSATAIVGAS